MGKKFELFLTSVKDLDAIKLDIALKELSLSEDCAFFKADKSVIIQPDFSFILRIFNADELILSSDISPSRTALSMISTEPIKSSF